MTRRQTIDSLASRLTALDPGHPLRVAVDGITAAGKSTLAAELTRAVARHRPAVHLSTDDYHHLAGRRHRDRDPARGYYRDAYDLDAFRERVLDPLGSSADRTYQARRHDLATDAVLDGPRRQAAPNAIVVVDGSFLQSAPLAGAWDVVLWLDVPYDVAAERAAVRDVALFGSPDAVRTAYAERYHAACRLYVAECDPRGTATIVLDNRDLDDLRIVSDR